MGMMQSKSIVQLTTHVDTHPSYDHDPLIRSLTVALYPHMYPTYDTPVRFVLSAFSFTCLTTGRSFIIRPRSLGQAAHDKSQGNAHVKSQRRTNAHDTSQRRTSAHDRSTRRSSAHDKSQRRTSAHDKSQRRTTAHDKSQRRTSAHDKSQRRTSAHSLYITLLHCSIHLHCKDNETLYW
jgi:hypothetical protein